MDHKFMKPGEDLKDVDKGTKKKWRWAWIEEIGSNFSFHHKYIYFKYFIFGSLEYLTIYWLSVADVFVWCG